MALLYLLLLGARKAGRSVTVAAAHVSNVRKHVSGKNTAHVKTKKMTLIVIGHKCLFR